MINLVVCAERHGKRRKRSINNHELPKEIGHHKITKRQAEEESVIELAMRSYGSQLRYECGLARKFYDPEYERNYTERWMTCNWNKTWTLYDSLDECIWVQYLYPPEPPPEAQLTMLWTGDPVEFNDNISYVCSDEEINFEWDREMTEFNITCLPGGTWDNPPEWPICILCK